MELLILAGGVFIFMFVLWLSARSEEKEAQRKRNISPEQRALETAERNKPYRDLTPEERKKRDRERPRSLFWFWIIMFLFWGAIGIAMKSVG